MAGLFDLEYHEKKIEEYQPPLAKLDGDRLGTIQKNKIVKALYMKSIGIKRIKESIGFLNLTYNLFRFEQLVRLKMV